MSKNRTRTLLRGMFSVLLLTFIALLTLVFIGIGFAGGLMLVSWDAIKDVDLAELEYHKADTWKQHLKFYSSVCTVQREDLIDFLLDKLKRLAYEEAPPEVIKPSAVGEYSIALDTAGETGTMWVYLQGFHYPRADQTPYRVEISVLNGKIDSIRNEDGEEMPHFNLEPELISEKYDERGTAREIVPLGEVPDKLRRAFLAIEDKRFYHHWGLDLKRIVGALVHYVRTGDLHGASTITQQLTRNIYLSPQRRILRKTKEALLAIRVERNYSKDEILERYLNFINLGRYGPSEVLGVQKAAKSYFGKPIWELELHECATLAGIPKSPTYYSPIRHPDRAKGRRDLILKQMLRAGFITQEEYEEAVDQALVIEMPKTVQLREAPHFLEYVVEQITQIPDLEDLLYSQGLKVYTTIDMSMQKVAERVVAEELRKRDKEYFKSLPDYDFNRNDPSGINPISKYLQAGLIAVEPKTGYIKAMVGGRDFYITQQKINFYNRAIQSQRQPGSAFKPIVFAAMLDMPPLVTPATIISDEAWSTESEVGVKWEPRNIEGEFHGDVTVRKILVKSINVATAKMMWETPKDEHKKPEGLKRTLALAERLGIQTRFPPYPSIALGSVGVSLLELSAAYGVFSNGGERAKPISIQYVEDQHGKILIENQVEREQVLDENVAYLVTHLMEGVIKYGTGRRAVSVYGLKRPAAGKTGTTNDNTDGWFIGYVPSLVAGVWVGFDNPRKSAKKTGAFLALPIWARFINEGARGPVGEEFRVPSGILFRQIDRETGLLKSEGKCPEEKIIREAFLVGSEPRMVCNVHE